MCNDYGNRIAYQSYVEAFSDLRIPLTTEGSTPNLEPRDDIWPTDPAPILRRTAEGVELAQLRWGFDPGRPKAGPVINFRSEGRRFQIGRCLVPASCFYEFTGTRSPKAKWRFTLEGADWFCLAGLWRPATATTPPAFTMLTTAPGPDVAPIHDRQVVVLERSSWLPWLEIGEPTLLAPPPGRAPPGHPHPRRGRPAALGGIRSDCFVWSEGPVASHHPRAASDPP